MNQCGILVPHKRDVLLKYLDPHQDQESCTTKCIRQGGHTGRHVFKIPGDRYIAWKDDPDCECCDPVDPDGCIVLREVNGLELHELIESENH